MARGKLTQEIKDKAQEVLGVEITQEELRLMPYIQYTMMNDQKIDPNKVSSEERGILKYWKLQGWIEGGATGLAITKEFWDAINQILWLGYVNHG